MPDFNYALAALGATVTVSNFTTGNPGDHTIDGSETTFWGIVNNTSANYCKIDLGAPQYITNARLNAGGGADVNDVWGLQYSDDGTNWNNVGVAFDTVGDETLPTGGLTYRYWRIYYAANIGTGRMVYAFELLGPVEAPPPPTNPVTTYIQAWLDGLEANYVPDVADWLAAQ